MAKVKDILDKTFGKLTVISKTSERSNDGCVVWECLCECGNIILLTGPQLKSGRWVSCGCYRLEKSRKHNTYVFCDGFVKVFDSKHRYACVDIQDFDSIKDYYWFYNNGYFITVTGSKYKPIRLHNFIFGPVKEGNEVDHIDRVKHNNRRYNLRESTRGQNNINHGLSIKNTSGFVGVSSCRDKFRSYITVDNKQIHLGVFDTPEEAYKVRLEAENTYFGNFSSQLKEVISK